METDLVKLMQALIDVAEGRAPADLVFVNASIVDVYRLRVARGQVAVKFGCIAGVLFEGRDCEDASVPAWEAMRVVDCQGRYLAPGFIDGHLHIESSNIRPAEYARMALSRGTTTAIADSHEIANVCGLDGLAFMIEDASRAPLDIKFMMPSCVPALPDEQAGAVITAADMWAFMDEHRGAIFGLGEMMNLPGVFGADEETCRRIAVGAQTVSGQVDGHAPMTAGDDLNAYVAAGVIADHENTGVEEALDELSRGMYVMLREGTCSHDLASLAPIILENPALARRCCFATDDRAPSDALNIGMIDNACRVAVEEGIDPVIAISMATLSTADVFGLDHGTLCAQVRRGSIAPGKRADILLLDDLAFTEPPHRVYSAGELVAEAAPLWDASPRLTRAAACLSWRAACAIPSICPSSRSTSFPMNSAPARPSSTCFPATPSPARRIRKRMRACAASCSSSVMDAVPRRKGPAWTATGLRARGWRENTSAKVGCAVLP